MDALNPSGIGVHKIIHSFSCCLYMQDLGFMWEVSPFGYVVVHEFFILLSWLLFFFMGNSGNFKNGVYYCHLPRYPSTSLFFFFCIHLFFILYRFIEVLLKYREPAYLKCSLMSFDIGICP